MNIAIIPARGGSKRFPRKNIAPFMGKPMLIWTCEAARKSDIFDTIIVSTEDEEIAHIVNDYGFDVFYRDMKFATAKATCADVCNEVLEHYIKLEKYYINLCCLYATAPLRTYQDIINTMKLLEDNFTLSSFAIVQCNYPPHQAFFINNEENLISYFPLLAKKQSQDLPLSFVDNGSTYAIKVSEFLKRKDFYTSKMRGHIMPPMCSVDIDTYEDYEIALCFAQYLQNKETSHAK